MDEEGNFREQENVHVAALSGDNEDIEKNGPLTIGFGAALGGNLRERGRHGMRWGPEWGFGVTLAEHLENPVLIIKTSWGGKSWKIHHLHSRRTGIHGKKPLQPGLPLSRVSQILRTRRRSIRQRLDRIGKCEPTPVIKVQHPAGPFVRMGWVAAAGAMPLCRLNFKCLFLADPNPAKSLNPPADRSFHLQQTPTL